MGLLTGKFNTNSFLPKDDVRGAGHSWTGAIFRDGKPAPEALEKLDAIRDILVSDGRTPAQGSLAWIWAKSGNTIPIPGFKSVKQIEENSKAMDFGPLSQKQMEDIDHILSSLKN
jgi:aryl-alcohol dehydrogenase-like predicted oxidoreductase